LPKIAIIGAGSYVFGRRLVTDFLSYEELRNSTIALMDPDPSGLELTSAIASKIVEQYHFPAKIESTTNRREALEDADYVVISFRVGGREATRLDLEIPAKYGVK
jgi:alpha-galactosidase